MKKIIFMVINMNVGGTEKALLNLIGEIPNNKYDITILMLEKYGGFLEFIPSHVHIEYIKDYPEIKRLLNDPPQKVIQLLIESKEYLEAARYSLAYVISKITNRGYLLKYIVNKFQNINIVYDIAVAYAGPMDLISYFVAKKIQAKQKIQWIHFDVTKIGFDKKLAAKIYSKFDTIFVVSEEGKSKLLGEIPKISEKLKVYPNTISSKQIIKMSNNGEGFNDDFKGMRILTVGRLSVEKGQDTAIKTMAELKKEGLNVRWYCLGDGKAKSEYESLIKKYDLEKDFILLGSNSNPYPYMKQCDIYVQPSRHEGFCITLAEAKCFSKPIICTDFTGAKEQLKHYQLSVIVNHSKEQLTSAIKKFIDSTGERNQVDTRLHREEVQDDICIG